MPQCQPPTSVTYEEHILAQNSGSRKSTTKELTSGKGLLMASVHGRRWKGKATGNWKHSHGTHPIRQAALQRPYLFMMLQRQLNSNTQTAAPPGLGTEPVTRVSLQRFRSMAAQAATGAGPAPSTQASFPASGPPAGCSEVEKPGRSGAGVRAWSRWNH